MNALEKLGYADKGSINGVQTYEKVIDKVVKERWYKLAIYIDLEKKRILKQIIDAFRYEKSKSLTFDEILALAEVIKEIEEEKMKGKEKL